MHISQLLDADGVVANACIPSKKRLLERVSEMLSDRAGGPSTRQIFEGLIGRERLGSTGLGNGVAIPHGRVDDSARPVAVFVQLEQPIAFDAMDGKPVDLVFALLVPSGSTQEHLEILAQVARILSDPDVCARLRGAQSAAEVLGVLGAENNDA